MKYFKTLSYLLFLGVITLTLQCNISDDCNAHQTCYRQICFQCPENCEDCTYSPQKNATLCNKCSEGYQPSSTATKCQDICGDGIRIDLPCDDLNNKNGDGCSSDCQIEPGWFCFDKAVNKSTKSSICKEAFQNIHQDSEEEPSKIVLELWDGIFIDEENSQTLNQYISLKMYERGDGELIKGYEYDIRSESTTPGQIVIELNDIMNSLPRSYAYIEVTDPKEIFRYEDGELSNQNFSTMIKLEEIVATPLETLELVQNISSSVQIYFGTLLIMSVVLALAKGRYLTFNIVCNTMQTILFLGFYNTNYPQNIKKILQSFAIIKPSFLTPPLEGTLLEKKFQELSFESINSIVNLWTLLIVILSLFTLSLIQSITKKVQPSKMKSVLEKITHQCGVNFAFNIILNFAFIIGIAAFIQLKNANTDRLTEILGISLSSVLLVLYFISIRQLLKSGGSKRNQSLSLQFFDIKQAYQGLKPYPKERTNQACFPMSRVIKTMIQSFFIIFLQNYPTINYILQLTIESLFVIILLKFRPFNKTRSLIIHLLIEFILVLGTIFAIIFKFKFENYRLDDNEYIQFGWTASLVILSIAGLVSLDVLHKCFVAFLGIFKKQSQNKKKRVSSPQVEPSKNSTNTIKKRFSISTAITTNQSRRLSNIFKRRSSELNPKKKIKVQPRKPVIYKEKKDETYQGKNDHQYVLKPFEFPRNVKLINPLEEAEKRRNEASGKTQTKNSLAGEIQLDEKLLVRQKSSKKSIQRKRSNQDVSVVNELKKKEQAQQMANSILGVENKENVQQDYQFLEFMEKYNRETGSAMSETPGYLYLRGIE